jgi:hypothetical protein
MGASDNVELSLMILSDDDERPQKCFSPFPTSPLFFLFRGQWRPRGSSSSQGEGGGEGTHPPVTGKAEEVEDEVARVVSISVNRLRRTHGRGAGTAAQPYSPWSCLLRSLRYDHWRAEVIK